MDAKTLELLEYPKILERLAEYCAFPASVEKARALKPTSDLFEARQRQTETSEAAALLLVHSDLTIGGARDVREQVDLAMHGGVLATGDLLDVKYTLVAARTLARTFERLSDQYPKLADLAAQLPPPLGIIDAITHAISDRGDILDSASAKLAVIRRDMRVVHDRLLSKLQKIVGDSRNAQFLQEALVTQRDGRYVVPLRAEFKGRIKSIVHDQSASGATLFVEPLSVIDLNNQHRELALAERDEERRILTELSGLVGEYAYEINQVVDVIAELDLILARARYAADLEATEPKLLAISGQSSSVRDQPSAIDDKPSSINNPQSIIRLYQARHPLLNPESVVPIDVEMDGGDPHAPIYAMVITGPNTGGKTVTLKTVALLALMAQSGLHIPAHSGSQISVFEQICADIGDEQSIEQSLSTFSGHITNIIRILEQADKCSLVVLDELGAGTDPQEGAALARALLSHLLERGITTLVTTHHPELKAFAHSTPGAVNASMEFDLETLRPTFRLTIGLPGRSNALDIAERLGLPGAIVASARSEISPDELQAEDLLDEIYRQRDLAQEARAAAEANRRETEELRLELLERLEHIEDERREALEDARQEGIAQLEVLRVELSQARRALSRARQPLRVVESLEEQVAAIEQAVERPIERKEPEFGPALERVEVERRRSIRLGDKVRLRSLGAKGVVSALGEQEAEVQVGMLRVRAKLSDLELPHDDGGPSSEAKPSPEVDHTGQAAKPRAASVALHESPGIELDIRGKRADEAMESLENYLDAAFLAGLPYVRIIHGKGTGKLRQVVREALSGHPHVNSFQAGGEKEGGDGVTVARLKSG